MAEEIVSARGGLASRSQRLGVTPFVLLLKRSGKASARSRTVVSRRNLEWIAATPLVLCEPTIARFAIRTCFVLALLDYADPGRSSLVAGKSGANVVHEPPVDLVDDLEMTRNEELHPLDRPALERLGQERMIGVGERALGDVESLIPPEMGFVEQNAHELRRRQRRMRIVHLDRRLVGQRPPIRVRFAKSAHDIAERTGDKEIFLHQPELAPLHRMIVGIENARQRFRVKRFGDRGDEIAAAELLEVETLRGGGAPEPQCVDRVAAIADHRPVIGNADEPRGAVRHQLQRALAQIERACELHLDVLGGRTPPTGPDV